MAWPFVSGEILTAANLNAVTLPVNAICIVRRAIGQLLGSGTLTTLIFDTEDLDPRVWHDNATNNTRVTPTIAGWYEATGTGAMASDTDYTRLMLNLQKNGAALTPPRYIDFTPMTGTVAPGTTLASGGFQMNGTTDYLELQGRQTNTSGGSNQMDASLTVRLVSV